MIIQVSIPRIENFINIETIHQYSDDMTYVLRLIYKNFENGNLQMKKISNYSYE